MSPLGDLVDHFLADYPPGIQLPVEIGVPVLALFAFLVWERLVPGGANGLTRAFVRFSHKRAACFLLVAALPVLLRLAMLPWWGVPVPWIHDDFSHLLLADTLLHGRLANPPHPLYQHIETIYVLQRPTYSSIYPLGTAGTLALGAVLTGTPWAGVCIAIGLMFATTYWMLLAWVERPWALFGAVLAGLALGVTSGWMNTYSGGPLSGVGGALVFGALPRLLRKPRARDGVLLGLGGGMIFFIRPYECTAVVLMCAAGLLWGLAKAPDFTWRVHLVRAFACALPVVAGVLLLTLLHNSSVTGSPWTFPYQLGQKSQGAPQSFLFQKPVPVPEIGIQELDDVAHRFEDVRLKAATPDGYARHVASMILSLFTFYVGFHFLPAIPGLVQARRSREVWLPAAICILGTLPCLLYGWFYVRYVAQYLCLIMLLVVVGLRATREARIRGFAVGRAAFAYVLAACLMIALRGPVGSLLGTQGFLLVDRNSRSMVEQHVLQTPGRHLIFVKYGPKHNFMIQWIANGADVDRSRIVWARSLNPESDAKAIEYWKGRSVWDVYADEEPVRLVKVR